MQAMPFAPRRLRSALHLGIAAALAAALAGCGSDDPQQPLVTGPSYPEKPVEILVDGLGISHVYAESDADAFFGAGYAMARDRLFHMELFRRRALGRLAEVFGQDRLKDDIGARTFGFGRLGEADYARLRQERGEDAAQLEAWVAGVNRRIDEIARNEVPRPYGLRPSQLDFVPEPWTPAHALAVGKVLSFGLSTTLEQEVLATILSRLVPETVANLPILMPAQDAFTMGAEITPTSAPAGPFTSFPAEPLAALPEVPWSWRPFSEPYASNNWAVAGEHTDNGRPLLAGDPHQALTSPSRFWPVHMSSVAGGGHLDVIGFSFVGTPGVQLGHNAHLGWTATTNFADAMDLWDVEAGSDCSAAEVQLGGQALATETRTEIIRVRGDGSPVGVGEDIELPVHRVPGHGVFLPDDILPAPRPFIVDGCLLLNWTGFAPTLEGSAYAAMDRAENIDEYEQAADIVEVGAANFIAADKDNITYHVNARIPDRGDPASRPMPWRVLSSDDPASLWTGSDLPPSKLPRWRNPERGYLVTANNDPFGFTADGDVENDPFYYGAFFANGFRAARITWLLEETMTNGLVTRADMQSIQHDVFWELASVMTPRVQQAIADAETDPALAEYQGRPELALLSDQLAWTYQLTRDQAAPVVFNALSWFAARRAFGPSFGPTFETIHAYKPSFFMGMLHNTLTERYASTSMFTGGDPRLLLLGAAEDTAAWLTARFGAVDGDYRWKDVHMAEFPTEFGSLLEVEPFPVDGGDDTVNVSPAPFFEGEAVRERFGALQGSLYRMVIGFGEDGTPEATLTFVRGTSEDPESPHFGDQDEAWVKGQYVPLPFRRADVDAQVTERLTLGSR
jgi:penicillin amidase